MWTALDWIFISCFPNHLDHSKHFSICPSHVRSHIYGAGSGAMCGSESCTSRCRIRAQVSNHQSVLLLSFGYCKATYLHVTVVSIFSSESWHEGFSQHTELFLQNYRYRLRLLTCFLNLWNVIKLILPSIRCGELLDIEIICSVVLCS